MTGAHAGVSTPHDQHEISSDLHDRLARLGSVPVEPATRSEHLTAMASVPARHRRGVRDKLKVGAALAGGFLLGSTGLAFAGALPTPAQDAASDALARVGISVPAGTERYFGEECVAGDDGSQARNRGQYLKQERAKGADALAAAKASDCGRPLVSLDDDADVETDADVNDDDATEATTPDKCVDGVKVTGQSEGKGRSDAAAKATKACDTPEPAAGADRGKPDEPGAADGPDEDHADRPGGDRGRSAEADRGVSGKANSQAPASPGAAGEHREDD